MDSFRKDLGDGLVLRTVESRRDVDRYAAFHEVFENEACGITADRVIRHHPDAAFGDFLLVEDQTTGEVVSTSGLIPWRCVLGGVPVDVAMLEFVRTHPGYRSRGLIRAQMERFHQIVGERRFDLSIIWGIPYYYRQFGYGYAIDNYTADSLPGSAVPEPPASNASAAFGVRNATVDDIPALALLYEESAAGLDVYDARADAYWRFLLEWLEYPMQTVIDTLTGRVVGYFCEALPGSAVEEGEITRVLESSVSSCEVGMFVLRQLRDQGRSEIQLGWPQTGALVQIGRSLGSSPLPAYQWLIRLCDVGRFVTRIKPLVARRLAESTFSDATGQLVINLYQEAFRLDFAAGKLLRVAEIGFVDASVGEDGGDLCIPPEAFVRLVLGYRTLEQLQDAWPDIVIKAESRDWIDTLFPPMTSDFSMPWWYVGPTSAEVS